MAGGAKNQRLFLKIGKKVEYKILYQADPRLFCANFSSAKISQNQNSHNRNLNRAPPAPCRNVFSSHGRAVQPEQTPAPLWGEVADKDTALCDNNLERNLHPGETFPNWKYLCC